MPTPATKPSGTDGKPNDTIAIANDLRALYLEQAKDSLKAKKITEPAKTAKAVAQSG